MTTPTQNALKWLDWKFGTDTTRVASNSDVEHCKHLRTIRQSLQTLEALMPLVEEQMAAWENYSNNANADVCINEYAVKVANISNKIKEVLK